VAYFRRYNLLDDLSALGRFDIVLCRNVAIYFAQDDRQRLFARIIKQMERPGCLVIGNMESLGNSVPGVVGDRYLRTMYYRFASSSGS
jgi:chemotaxis protein methyltransferase CheR